MRSQERWIDDLVERPEPKAYERRARHKTKPDLYESKKQNTRKSEGCDDGGERKSKRKRSRAQRDGDGKLTEGLIEGFRLKNGPYKQTTDGESLAHSVPSKAQTPRAAEAGQYR
jgi:hypothetical protein